MFTNMFTVMIVVCLLKSMCIPSFVLIGCCVSELHCPHRNVLPEAVYCCFTRTTLFSKLFTCFMILEVVITSPSFIALHPLVSEIAKCIA